MKTLLRLSIAFVIGLVLGAAITSPATGIQVRDLIGWLMTAFGWLAAVVAALWVRDAWRREHVRKLLREEIGTLALWAGISAAFAKGRADQQTVFHLQVRMEIYDRLLEDLALLPTPLWNAVTAWYQAFKTAMWKLEYARLASKREGSTTVDHSDYAEAQRAFVHDLERLLKDGSRLEIWLRTGKEPRLKEEPNDHESGSAIPVRR